MDGAKQQLEQPKQNWLKKLSSKPLELGRILSQTLHQKIQEDPRNRLWHQWISLSHQQRRIHSFSSPPPRKKLRKNIYLIVYLFIYFLLLWKRLEQSGGIKFMDGAKQQLEQPRNLTNYYYSPIWR